MPAQKTLPDKLLLKPDASVALVGAPDDQAPLFADRARAKDAASASAVVLYAATSAKLAKALPAVAKKLGPESRLWVCYPKAGQLDTDLSRDALWEQLAPHGFEGVRLVSVDATWSAMMFRRTAAAAKPSARSNPPAARSATARRRPAR